ncbi:MULTISPECIES: phage tail assembly chaperone [unclassified Pseudomonas]|uniref:phage tail assembly chaperone n=1 Tax=unclassified Pseudomonas TaxID=196821 RepID=UPI002A367D61|nr:MULTISPECIES: phage tail assembly chaperone [unclassified Pseudomonas]MDX9673129.1 phage tail assembly chaperone [Pseudomonas sp. P8_250]WPN38328.1 phage tail assembly chaperone [Pseudomonas sp. P8_139]WPN39870.1 phage tail assembly chaperone [Pseudomonas sp. P8_229]
MRYYSKTTGSTYLDTVHSSMPDDVRPIPEARYLEVFANRPLGKICAHDEEGLPVLIDRPALSPAESAEQERSWRNEQIKAVLWLRDRHRDQHDSAQLQTLSADQFNELLTYIRDLRDWPQSPSFPSRDLRPVAPAWVIDPLQ